MDIHFEGTFEQIDHRSVSEGQAGNNNGSTPFEKKIIQEIFGVQMFRLQHPNKQRMLSSLDVMMGGQSGFFVNKKSSLTTRI